MRFKITFDILGSKGETLTFGQTEVVEANGHTAAEEILKRKYGRILVRSVTFPNDGQPSSGTVNSQPRQHSHSNTSGGGSNSSGAMAGVGVIALIIVGISAISNPPTPPSSTDQQESTPAAPSPEALVSPEGQQESTEQVAEESPQSLWGAFAVSPSTSASEWSKGYSTEEEAKKAALEACGQDDCEAFSIGPGYAVLAESDKRWYYSQGHASQDEAVQAAINECTTTEPDADCRVTHSINF